MFHEMANDMVLPEQFFELFRGKNRAEQAKERQLMAGVLLSAVATVRKHSEEQVPEESKKGRALREALQWFAYPDDDPGDLDAGAAPLPLGVCCQILGLSVEVVQKRVRRLFLDAYGRPGDWDKNLTVDLPFVECRWVDGILRPLQQAGVAHA